MLIYGWPIRMLRVLGRPPRVHPTPWWSWWRVEASDDYAEYVVGEELPRARV